ncbi:MAG: Phosphate regulon transcriptional regulatory protein PhoB (SphR) [uncultured Chloroflexi bacterium]|uniref:Phosphate regulon transcriptional regulatory protein PhoB (SphR) n=1 Tax=uncultured Chloroflexota bacterium TaxID=166587 RepID=A0A6J4K8W1_9CHLR|nr:MAG: Phosphate regulon transcriptional regulatory protein PhoB (SphR) [uncultured Chloroflexota bacterium]
MVTQRQAGTILLVEDEAELGKVIVREVEAAGYAVLHARDGSEALRRFAQHAPDLVILDWMLPGMDGIEVLRRLRQNSAVPVLMLTARAEEVDRVIGLEVGADDYLTKPFGTRELIARVRALLRRHERLEELLAADRTQGASVLRVGPVELDPESHQAHLDRRPLDLTRTEFGLLHLLQRNRGRAFSRDYLHEAVWGESSVAGDRSVDNAVLRLRKKLGAYGDRVETVWGVGYRLRHRD